MNIVAKVNIGRRNFAGKKWSDIREMFSQNITYFSRESVRNVLDFENVNSS